MEYPFYLEQKFFDVGRLETRTLTAQEAEALNYEDGYKAHGEGYTLYVDGYNSLQIFMKIILPISKPIFASCAIVNLNFVWNEFLFANVFLNNKALQTIPIGLMTFKGDLKVDYTTTLAGLMIASAPLIILFICMSRQFVRGLTSGAVKG